MSTERQETRDYTTCNNLDGFQGNYVEFLKRQSPRLHTVWFHSYNIWKWQNSNGDRLSGWQRLGDLFADGTVLYLNCDGDYSELNLIKGFPQWLSSKNPSAMQELQEMWVRPLSWEDSPGGRHGHALQYSCLENPMDRGAWRATVHRVAKHENNWSNWKCMHTW